VIGGMDTVCASTARAAARMPRDSQAAVASKRGLTSQYTGAQLDFDGS
jgi:hypothetical protein